MVRAQVPDLYVSALLAPRNATDDLMALAAFWAETGRIALTVGEPMLAQIRLQWWRDAFAENAGPTGHPVTDTFREVVARRGLDRGMVQAVIDAREHELSPTPFADEPGFSRYLDDCDGMLLRLAASIRGLAAEPGAETFLAEAAQALGRMRVALDLPYFAAKGRLPLWPEATGSAQDLFDTESAPDGRQAIVSLASTARQARDRARRLFPGISRRLIDAGLPLALLEPYLRALEKKARDPLRDVATIAPLSRVIRLTWAHMTGHL